MSRDYEYYRQIEDDLRRLCARIGEDFSIQRPLLSITPLEYRIKLAEFHKEVSHQYFNKKNVIIPEEVKEGDYLFQKRWINAFSTEVELIKDCIDEKLYPYMISQYIDNIKYVKGKKSTEVLDTFVKKLASLGFRKEQPEYYRENFTEEELKYILKGTPVVAMEALPEADLQAEAVARFPILLPLFYENLKGEYESSIKLAVKRDYHCLKELPEYREDLVLEALQNGDYEAISFYKGEDLSLYSKALSGNPEVYHLIEYPKPEVTLEFIERYYQEGKKKYSYGIKWDRFIIAEMINRRGFDKYLVEAVPWEMVTDEDWLHIYVKSKLKFEELPAKIQENDALLTRAHKLNPKKFYPRGIGTPLVDTSEIII